MEGSRWSWAQLRSQVAIDLVVTLAVAAIGAVWTFLKVYAFLVASTYGVWSAVGAGLLAALLIVALVTQVYQLDQAAQRRRLARRSPYDVEKQIWVWLREHQFSAKDVARNAPADEPALDFRIEADDDSHIVVTIVKAKHRPWVTVAGRMNFDAADAKLTAITRKAGFRQDLAIELLRFGVDYVMDSRKDGSVGALHVNRNFIFDEKTSPLDLFNTIRDVRNSLRLTVAIIARATGNGAA